MANTTMFDTIDALVMLVAGLPQVQPPADVGVSDGFPAGLANNVVVSIGGSLRPTVTVNSRTSTMDGQVDEVYEVEGTVTAKSGGSTQKTVRDAAKTVYEAIEAAVRSAFQPGGDHLGVTGLEFAEVFAGDLQQSTRHDNLNERHATLTFQVRCTGYI